MWRFEIVEERDDFGVGEDVNENKSTSEEAGPIDVLFRFTGNDQLDCDTALSPCR